MDVFHYTLIQTHKVYNIRVNPNVNYRLQVITHVSAGSSVLTNVHFGGECWQCRCAYVGAGGEWEISPQVCSEPKIVQKSKVKKRSCVAQAPYIWLRGHQFAIFDSKGAVSTIYLGASKVVLGLPSAQSVKNLPAMQETQVRFLGCGSPGQGNGNPPQCSCLENPMDRGAWQASLWGCKRVGFNLVTETTKQ